MQTTLPPRLAPEQFRERLFRRIRTAIPTRYKLPATEEEAREMLTQCYLGELYKRGALPVPPGMAARAETGKTMPSVRGRWEVRDGEAAANGGAIVRKAMTGTYAVAVGNEAAVPPGASGHGGAGEGKAGKGENGARCVSGGKERSTAAGELHPSVYAPEFRCGGLSGGSKPTEIRSVTAGIPDPGDLLRGGGFPDSGDLLRAGGFPDPGTAARIAKAARWLTGKHRPGLLLYGTVGSGKSTLARAICELIGILHDSPLRSERLAVARTSAPDLIELKAPREARAAADSEELFARLRSAPMLLIDDLGVEATAVRSWGNCLTPVIDLLYYRYDRRLFTLVTTNLDDEAIESVYGMRIADRMAEMFDRIGHTGRSYRR